MAHDIEKLFGINNLPPPVDRSARTLEGVISAMRAYLRQWMAADWMGPDVQALRDGVDSLVSKSAIDAWMELALKRGIDPL